MASFYFYLFLAYLSHVNWAQSGVINLLKLTSMNDRALRMG